MRKIASSEVQTQVRATGRPVKIPFLKDKASAGQYVLRHVTGNFSTNFDLVVGEDTWQCHVHAQRRGDKVDVTFQLPSGITVSEQKKEARRERVITKRAAKRRLVGV